MPKTNLTKGVEEKVEEKVSSTPQDTTKNQIEILNAELAKRDKEIEDLKNLMLTFMAGQGKNKDDDDDEYVYINNNSVGKVNFVLDSEGKSAYYIEAGIQGRPISKEDIALALKIGTMRKLFELGVLEFVDKKNYKKFGIVQLFDLSEKHVIELLSPENIAQNYSSLENLIKTRKERTLEHELCYKALDLVDRGLLPRNEESQTIIYLNKLFCSNRTTTFLNLLSGLEFKRGDWKN